MNAPRTTRCLIFRLVAFLAVALVNGCAAVSSPVVDGIPVRRLPPEYLGESRENEVSIPLSSLRQPAPEYHELAPGDVLGVYVEGVVGEKGTPPPVRLSDQGNVPPALGYPLPVREDGTVPLPLIDAVKVAGLSLAQAQAKIVEAYTVKKKILNPGRPILITLLKPRSYNVLVLREDAGGSTIGTSGGFGVGLGGGSGSFFQETRKTAGFALDLPAYENDVLNALTRSGGLPGTEAENEVIIERGASRDPSDASRPEDLMRRIQGRGRTTRIPLRTRPDQPMTLRPEEVLLQSGDVVVVKARRSEVFYTGGLLPSRAFPLPRDRDLDIVQALALVGAPILNGGFNANNLSGALVQTGIGFPSPSQVTVLRKTANNSQVPIIVNLNRALKDPRERILVQPGDIVILQQSVDEAFAQYFVTNFRFNFFGTLIRQRDLTATSNVTLP